MSLLGRGKEFPETQCSSSQAEVIILPGGPPLWPGLLSIPNKLYHNTFIVEHRPSLTPNHLAKICRIVKEGPAPGTKKAEALRKKALRRWPSQHGRRFTTNSFMHCITSSTATAQLWTRTTNL